MYARLVARIISGVGPSKSTVRWERDVGVMTMEEWDRILKRGALVSISSSQKISHLFLIYRVYYTPKKMFKHGWRQNDECPRCKVTGDFIHMVWKCPKLFRYWEIIDRINTTFKTTLEPAAKTCLLKCMEERRVLTGTTEVALRCLFQVRKLIAQKLQAQIPPTVKN